MDEKISNQAARLERLLPLAIRRLFTLEAGHPVAELPLGQLRVCMILEPGPRPMTAISEDLGISVSAVTQIADRLERAGLVMRESECDDRRMKLLRLTPHGADLMRARQEERVRRAADALSRMRPEQREAALDALSALAEAATGIASEPSSADVAGERVAI